MILRPLNDTIIVKQEMERNESIIAFPEKNSELKISQEAEIISYGPHCKRTYKPGQKVLIERFKDKPSWVHVNGEKYRLIRENYLLAEVDND